MDAEKSLDPRQCVGGRSMIGLSQRDLAGAVGLSERTVYAFEKHGKISRAAGLALRKVLEARGCRFCDAPGEVGVTIRTA